MNVLFILLYRTRAIVVERKRTLFNFICDILSSLSAALLQLLALNACLYLRGQAYGVVKIIQVIIKLQSQCCNLLFPCVFLFWKSSHLERV